MHVDYVRDQRCAWIPGFLDRRHLRGGPRPPAVAYEVEAVDRRCRIVIQSELVANEQLPGAN
ncbi:hypothetical protein AB0D38_20655, partial [Streptomyces sp. NPDC048279]|uniref:hypothetical protein n=1 Tax=Streptomyces sp. NPDC048279 TaxID=3154714 RepID=UPI00343BA7B9